MVRILSFHYHDSGSVPGQGTENPSRRQCGTADKKRNKTKLPANKSPGLDGFTGDSTKHTKKNLYLSFPNYCKSLKKRETLPKSFYEATITLISNPDKDITKKENYRPIYLIDINAKSSIKY